MFEKNQLSVIDWFLFFVLMSIPIVNIILFIIILVNGNTNPTLKSFMICNIVFVIIMIVLVIAMFAGISAFFQGFFDNLPTTTIIPFLLKFKLF